MPSRYCPTCQNELLIDDPSLGKQMLCPFCHKIFVPPYAHSGLGIVSCIMGGFIIVVEIAIIITLMINPTWESEGFGPKHLRGLLKFLSMLSVFASWIGIACAGMAYQQKRRNKLFAKWGLILNILPNLFCMGYVVARPFLPTPAPTEPEKEEEKPPQPMEEKEEAERTQHWRLEFCTRQCQPAPVFG